MGGLGIGAILIAAFLAVIAAKGTYKLLPPFSNNIQNIGPNILSGLAGGLNGSSGQIAQEIQNAASQIAATQNK